MEDKKKKHQIKIELEEGIGQGEYSNFVMVSHSPAEFIIDFIRVLPGVAKAKVKSRLIMSPMHAKALINTLQDNVKKFEDKFGEIKTPTRDSSQGRFELPEDVLPN